MLTPIEVDRGLVIRFDPARLLEAGAAPTVRSRDRAVVGCHYFLCIGNSGRWSIWTPAFSRWLPGRQALGYKAGSPDWVGQPGFVDMEQLWILPPEALAPGSAGVDHTRRGQRNMASTRFLYGNQDLQAAG
jgi:hypothetical protein